MRWAAIAFAVALFALPASAQVEIRGLTIAPPDRPGNGGIMLKALISTRLPGPVSDLITRGDHALVLFGNEYHRLEIRNGELVHHPAAEISSDGQAGIPTPAMADLDGDGKNEAIEFDRSPSRLVVMRYDGEVRRVATVVGYGQHRIATLVDAMRAETPQVVAVGDEDNCLRVFALRRDTLETIGSLSCGSTLVGQPVMADLDGDGRKDLIAIRKPDRIEIFLR